MSPRVALLRSMAVVAVASFLVLFGLTRLFGAESLLRQRASDGDLLEACAVGALVLGALYGLARTRFRKG